MRITIIGSDSFHIPVFTKLLLERGCKVSILNEQRSTLKESINRRDKVQSAINLIEGVNLIESIEDTDGFMILGLDASTHLEQIKEIVHFGKPIYVDKPLTYSLAEALEIKEIGKEIPIFSASVFRFSKVIEAIVSRGDIKSLEITGPLNFIEGIPGLFWYGIHLFEILNEILPGDVESIKVEENFSGINYYGFINSVKFAIKTKFGYNEPVVVTVNNIPYEIESVSENYEFFIEKLIKFFSGTYSGVSIESTLKVIETLLHVL